MTFSYFSPFQSVGRIYKGSKTLMWISVQQMIRSVIQANHRSLQYAHNLTILTVLVKTTRLPTHDVAAFRR